MNIVLIQEQLAHIELTLETEDEFEVYGGTTRAPFEFQPTGLASWRVIVRESEVAGAAIRAFDIYARQRSTGREWVVLSGKIIVKPRTADIEGDKLSPVEYHVSVPVVDSVLETQGMAIVTGIPGPQGPQGDKGDPGDGNVTAEAIQAVAPIAWFDSGIATANTYGSTAFGVKTWASTNATALGYGAEAYTNAIALGYNAKTLNGSYHEIVIGQEATANNHCSITVGSNFGENVNGSISWHKTRTEGTGSITIGAGANTLNNGDTESSNSVTIGCKASNQGADSVVIGAGASNVQKGCIIIGAGAKGSTTAWHDCATVLGTEGETKGRAATALGYKARAKFNSVAIGSNAVAGGNGVAIGYDCGNDVAASSCSIGTNSRAKKDHSIAIGYTALVNDYGATVIRSTAEDGTYTQLYFSGANTPLANTYHGGAPMLGYVTKDSAGNIVAAGTRSLIDLLTDNSTFAPASLDENGEWVMPKGFHPSDLDMPQEEPSEPEEYQPLPVYPIVEPEVDELRTPTQEI